MGALLCVTASGRFDWLRLGRPGLYAFIVAATLVLAVVFDLTAKDKAKIAGSII